MAAADQLQFRKLSCIDLTKSAMSCVEVINLASDSDDNDQPSKRKIDSALSVGDATSRPRPAKRRRNDPSLTHISDSVDLLGDASHVSDTVAEASASKATAGHPAGPPSDAESPTLSPQQVSLPLQKKSVAGVGSLQPRAVRSLSSLRCRSKRLRTL